MSFPDDNARLHFESMFDGASLRNELLKFFSSDEVSEDPAQWSDLITIKADFRDHTNSGGDPIDFYRNSKFNLHRLAWNCAINDERGKALAAVKVANDGRYKTALDYGAGIGTTASALSLAGLKVTVADVSLPNLEFMTNRSKRMELKNFRTVDLVDGRKIGAKYDMIVCTEVLEHVVEPEELARFLDKRLKPGGSAVLSWSFVDLPTHLPQHFHYQAPHPDQLLTMGFGKFMLEEIGLKFGGYVWFNNMLWTKPEKIEVSVPVNIEPVDAPKEDDEDSAEADNSTVLTL